MKRIVWLAVAAALAPAESKLAPQLPEQLVAHYQQLLRTYVIMGCGTLAGEIRMLDPVGTPEKRGFEQCCAGPFALFQPKVRFRVHPGSLFVCGNEVAWLLENADHWILPPLPEDVAMEEPDR